MSDLMPCKVGPETSSEVVYKTLPAFAIRAGAREEVYHHPSTTVAAVVTTGSLCPGVNDCIQSLVHRLEDYGVKEGSIIGIRNGFQGFYDHLSKPIVLTKASVDGIHLKGGTVLGTSKSRSVDIHAVVEKLSLWNINMLFVIGGDGGQRAAQMIHEQCNERQLPCCIIGVPKSIENSILLIDRTFGFETAVEEAQRALEAAKVEASSSPLGVSIVRLMGRKSGWLAMQASLASGLVDITLIPEAPFALYGPEGLLAFVDKIIDKQGHAVICLSEGAGQDLLDRKKENHHKNPGFHLDSTGSPLMKDIGSLLRSRIGHHLGPRADVTLIDTMALIRTRPSHSQDHIYCKVLASNAVDAAFAGYSGVIVGEVSNHFCLFPIPVITQAVRRVDPAGTMWRATRSSMGQSLESPAKSRDNLRTLDQFSDE